MTSKTNSYSTILILGAIRSIAIVVYITGLIINDVCDLLASDEDGGV